MVLFTVAILGIGIAGLAFAAAKRYFTEPESLVAPENDKVRRLAKVYLNTHPIELLPGAKSEAYHHWALVFAFEDGSCRTLEGIGNAESKLVPSYTKERPSKDGTYYLLGEEEVSPWQLRELAVNNECNWKPYLATAHNCQDWVNNIAKHLGNP